MGKLMTHRTFTKHWHIIFMTSHTILNYYICTRILEKPYSVARWPTYMGTGCTRGWRRQEPSQLRVKVYPHEFRGLKQVFDSCQRGGRFLWLLFHCSALWTERTGLCHVVNLSRQWRPGTNGPLTSLYMGSHVWVLANVCVVVNWTFNPK